ncbi:MAG: hypothetical protein DMD54_11070 [Gemmatimonadetes bacterium]|nr:MAG: hypothetical protein DMD54_11070 [Gemmatimonadota bacterium]
MAVFVALPSAVPERRGQPEIGRAGGFIARAHERQAEQRVDARQLVVGGIERGGPPDIGAGLKDERRWIRRIAPRQRLEVRCRAREISAVQRIQSGAQNVARGSGLLEHQHDRGQHPDAPHPDLQLSAVQ